MTARPRISHSLSSSPQPSAQTSGRTPAARQHRPKLSTRTTLCGPQKPADTSSRLQAERDSAPSPEPTQLLRAPGVYAGELLTEAEHARRESSYCFSLLPPADELTSKALAGLGLDGEGKDDEYIAYIDGENAARSSWCRYINHAPHGARACNLEAKVDAMKALVWFEASRDIAPGEELCFGTRPPLSLCANAASDHSTHRFHPQTMGRATRRRPSSSRR